MRKYYNIKEMVKNIVILIQFIIILVLGWILYSNDICCKQNQISSENKSNSSKLKDKEQNSYFNANLSFVFIESEGKTWGYKILLEGNPMINQPNKPGLPGNEGFKTKEQAQTVAEFVIDKIRKGEIPPTVSIDELRTLGAL